MSFALDLTEGQPPGHSIRSCVIGMRIAAELELPRDIPNDLYYALLMKDAGCSSNASKMFQLLGTDDIEAKRDVKTTDWSRAGWESLRYALAHVRTHAPFPERVRALFDVAIHRKRNAREMVRIRCERGSDIARTMGLPENTALAIQSLDELWDGSGQPRGLRRTEIPVLSRVMNLAQTVEVFYRLGGVQTAVDIALKRSGRWFDPSLVRIFCSLAKNASLWEDVEDAGRRVVELEPGSPAVETGGIAGTAALDNICLAFAGVIDAKSPFTHRHSTRVAETAVAIARALTMSEDEVNVVWRAALLHDIGKLGVSNAILEKPDKLDPGEWEIVRRHPRYSLEILKRIPGFGGIAEIAGSHHERLDGAGYFRGMTAAELDLPSRILAVADVYDALASIRPYRDAMPPETVVRILEKDVPHALDAACVEALKHSLAAPVP